MIALNPWMLWGLVAASIPIIIHLLNRRRHRVVDWGAMQFLLHSHTSRNRRILLEELLLLLMRTALLALLALAMARLFVQNPYFAGAGATRQDVVIVLDASLSMSRASDGTTQFDRAVAAARQWIDALAPGDTVAVLAAAAAIDPLTEKPVYISDEQKAALQQRLLSLEPTASSLDMIRAIDAAAAVLADGGNPHQQILVVTDGQAHGWRAADAARWEFLAESLGPDGSRKPKLRVLRLPAPREPLANLAVSAIALERRIVGTDRPVRITVTVANTGATVSQTQPLDLVLGERRIDRADLPSLEPGASETLAFTHRFEKPGSVVVSAKLQPGDAMALDDVQHLAVDVATALPILIVEGAPSAAPLGSDAAYLTAALEPSDSRAVQPVDYLAAARVVEVPEAGRVDLAAFRAVVLANVRRVPDALLTKLRAFVEQGGGVLIAPGDRVDRAHYNDALYADGVGLLPARLGAAVGDAEAREEFEVLAEAAMDHPVMRLFAPPATIDLAKVHVYRRYPLEVPARASDVRVVASLANGDALAVEKRIGRGHVICTAVPWDADWSNLPACKAYVVLTHELVYYLADPLLPQWNIAAGEPFSVTLPAKDTPAIGQIFDAAGTLHAVTATAGGGTGRRVFRFDATQAPGVYRLVLTAAQTSRTHHFVVGLDSAESDLTRLRGSVSDRLAALTGLTFFDTPDDLQAALAVESPGREIWRWLAIGVFVLLLAEALLTRAIAGSRHGEASDAVDYGDGLAPALQ